MSVMIAQLCGVTDIHLLFAMFSLMASTQLFGWQMEVSRMGRMPRMPHMCHRHTPDTLTACRGAGVEPQGGPCARLPQGSPYGSAGVPPTPAPPPLAPPPPPPLFPHVQLSNGTALPCFAYTSDSRAPPALLRGKHDDGFPAPTGEVPSAFITDGTYEGWVQRGRTCRWRCQLEQRKQRPVEMAVLCAVCAEGIRMRRTVAVAPGPAQLLWVAGAVSSPPVHLLCRSSGVAGEAPRSHRVDWTPLVLGCWPFLAVQLITACYFFQARRAGWGLWGGGIWRTLERARGVDVRVKCYNLLS